jgi:hypothetical protein
MSVVLICEALLAEQMEARDAFLKNGLAPWGTDRIVTCCFMYVVFFVVLICTARYFLVDMKLEKDYDWYRIEQLLLLISLLMCWCLFFFSLWMR